MKEAISLFSYTKTKLAEKAKEKVTLKSKKRGEKQKEIIEKKKTVR